MTSAITDTLAHVRTHLQPRLTAAEVVVDRARRYFALVKNLIQSVNPPQYTELEAALSVELTPDAVVAQLNTPTDLLLAVAAVYDRCIKVDNALRAIMEMFANETYMQMAIYNMSATYTANTYRLRSEAASAYEQYRDNAIAGDAVILDDVLGAAGMTNEALYAFIVTHQAMVNRLTIEITKRLLASTTGALSAEKRRRIEHIIELQKNAVLGVGAAATAVASPLILRYGLRPLTRSLAMSALFAELGLVYDNDRTLAENWAQAAASGPGLILVDRSNGAKVSAGARPTPTIEFDLSGLIDAEYIAKHELKTNPVSGLTKKIIERYSTAAPIASDDAGAPKIASDSMAMPKIASDGTTVPLPTVQRIPGRDRDTWTLLETIDGIHWRVMGRNSTGGPAAPATTRLLDSSTAAGLLRGAPLRPHWYNLIQSDVILNRCFDYRGAVLLAEYEEMREGLASSEPLKAKIVEQLVKHFERSHGERPIGTARDLRQRVIDRDAITGAISRVLVHTRGTVGRGSAEYLTTYVARLDLLVTQLIKELERLWSAERIADRMFKELSGDELTQAMLAIFRGVTAAAVEEVDRAIPWRDYDVSLKQFFMDRKQAIA